MSVNPFAADPDVPVRLGKISDTEKTAIVDAVLAAIAPAKSQPQDNMGGVVPASVVSELVGRFGLQSERDLMCLLLDRSAREMAKPLISDFHVGAVGLETETGNLILGGNVEFPTTHLGYTLHGEGFVFTRAMSRGTNIAVIAIGEAHPCAHCRQCLAEYAASDRLELIDPLGHTLKLSDLYPWPFDPAYLGERGAVPGRELWPDLRFEEDSASPAAKTLLAAGRRSHSPYSKCPGALTLHLRDGAAVTGTAIESVAFNPTIHPVQSALVDLLAHGYGYADILGASLGTVRGGAVDYTASTRELLSRIAPDAPVMVMGWAV
ncbi:hypothetical protein ASG47_11895 [Devosia sp. Leaf420]|uniref:cytidine deaminase n=1 Tax=Devosia sp. Leaf420 TaxID=1736374 RepID=UPI000715CC3D|nr:cytidine deaminase [Devosia sp. Leaf420]KQT47269.1 hypothetical protein ASG47_11895 [Devosia sp. Leaf420]